MSNSSQDQTYTIQYDDPTNISINSQNWGNISISPSSVNDVISNWSGSLIGSGGTVTSYGINQNTAVMSVPYGENTVRIEETATLDVRGRVKINGEWLDERLERIETLLSIPTRDVTMEEKHPKLKQLYEQYMHELEKYKTWDRIKDSK